ncbi:NADH dehydrogenase [ubiquinone] 1 alpha subcomplex subunit 3 isoform X1 [Bubalus kerabau]|uniref:NADH dehydrogenase [ubiquinone] 1 alpha subcomplex subunit 3 isoform X1 n=1 Tax=Bubalus carabanensis TaxID=3119969 RepID=UPI00244EBCC9|nr:NADH dehydrogenase [ubiquinone] 1 alpha subcomplex subunit 3 isoform X1 [Bubalus carabanensis]
MTQMRSFRDHPLLPSCALQVPRVSVILPTLSPYTKYSLMINRATPYNYPVPLRDDGNMPDVPSHPQDPQGPSLEWLKRL